MDQFLDTSILTIVTSTVAGIVGWLSGRGRRRAENATAVTSAIDAFMDSLNKITEVNTQLRESKIALFAENIDLKQEVIKKDNEIEDLKNEVKALQGKVESLTNRIEELTKQVKSNATFIKKNGRP